mmetsp:Transcript_2359/g.4717  ORF Transcript_2359/g.4717 Transcript_2359/m.4717 type:complete len:274 (-) Transcript_2359:1092-1913(-)
MDGRTEMDPDGTRPEPPEADSPPHIPGQVSLSSSPPQPGLAAAVPVGGPNDTNAHQLDSATIQADTPGEDPTPTADSQPSVRPSNYKTRLCMKWQQQGECSFGARCNFAHGVDEMRQHQQHQHEIVAAPVFLNTQAQPRAVNENRKTRLCTKFHQFGTCPYAEKCNFAHGVHELKQPPPGLGDMNGHANGIGNGGGIGGGGGRRARVPTRCAPDRPARPQHHRLHPGVLPVDGGNPAVLCDPRGDEQGGGGGGGRRRGGREEEEQKQRAGWGE